MKMKLPFLSQINFTNTTSSGSSSSNDSRGSQWPWPAYCHQPKTLSFRTGHVHNHQVMFKTNNTLYNTDATTLSEDAQHHHDDESLYFNTNSSVSASFSTELDELGGDSVETVIRGLRSERLFFDSVETSSILEEAKKTSGCNNKRSISNYKFKESMEVLSMESRDPFVDFKKSMEEMVETYGLKDSWEGLEELFCCYLKVNGRNNHGYIIGAFVDLLVTLAFTNSSSTSTSRCINCDQINHLIHDHHHQHQNHQSPSSPLSFYTSSSSSSSDEYSCSSTNCVSLFEIEEEEEIDIGNTTGSTATPCPSLSKDDDHGNKFLIKEIGRS